MEKDEVIKLLKEHLKAKENTNGCLTNRDKWWSIHYVEDFLQYTKGQAIKFLERHIPAVLDL